MKMGMQFNVMPWTSLGVNAVNNKEKRRLFLFLIRQARITLVFVEQNSLKTPVVVVVVIVSSCYLQNDISSDQVLNNNHN